jgi:hypothetical protein
MNNNGMDPLLTLLSIVIVVIRKLGGFEENFLVLSYYFTIILPTQRFVEEVFLRAFAATKSAYALFFSSLLNPE